jgi:hypothetical protein
MQYTMRLGAIAGVLGVAGMVALGVGGGDPETATPAGSTGGTGSGAARVWMEATIAEAKFLSGRWIGVMNKDHHVEEMWSEPVGNNMVGCFRWVKSDGTPSLFELITVTAEEGTLALRLRHQTAAGKSWESQDSPMLFRLAEKSEKHLRFDAFMDCGTVQHCRYEHRDGKLVVDVVFKEPSVEEASQGKKTETPLHFEFSRSPL